MINTVFYCSNLLPQYGHIRASKGIARPQAGHLIVSVVILLKVLISLSSVYTTLFPKYTLTSGLVRRNI